MVRPLNAEQLAIIEVAWQSRGQASKPASNRSFGIAIACSTAGPHVTGQRIASYMNNREKRETGVLGAVNKHPEHAVALRQSFKNDPWPNTAEVILLVHSTGLSKLVVQKWFLAERHHITLRGGELERRSPKMKLGDASFMWHCYRHDPDGYVKKLRDGTVDPVSGRPLE